MPYNDAFVFPDIYSYPDSLRVTRAGEATQDPATGALTPGTPTVLLTGPCDVQDAQIEVQTDGSGDKTLEAGARVYVPVAKSLRGLRTGDRVTAVQQTPVGAWERTGEVEAVDPFDHKLVVRWL